MPETFNIDALFQKPETNDYKVAVLTSGGLDSLIAHAYAKQQFGPDNVVAVFVDYGQPYVNKEGVAVNNLHVEEIEDNIVFVKADCVHPKLNNMPTINQQEVYGRNILLAYYGALLAERTWMVALATEINPTAVRDKHPEFFHMLSGLFSFTFKSKRMNTIVESPFAHLTKTQEVALGLSIGLTPEKMMKSVSCYDPDHQNCGRCSTCFKRWIAMTNNQIEEETYREPWRSEYARAIISDMIAERDRLDDHKSRYSLARKIETHNALVRSGNTGIFETKDIIDDGSASRQH